MPSRSDHELNQAMEASASSLKTRVPISAPATPPPAFNREQLRFLIVKFVATWLSFIAVLCCIALLTDINWARSFMQRALGETLHRDVRLGKLTWSFGLDGLEIDTRKIIVNEHNGRPFLLAGKSGIGVAFRPLLHGKLALRHVVFDQPEIWAVRTGKGQWNFSDLLEYGPDIRYIRCDGGTVHLIDSKEQKPDWQQIDLQRFKLSFLWPRKHRKTPFFLAFKLSGKDYTSSLEIDGYRSGKDPRWQDDNYSFDIKTDKLNPNDFKPLLIAIGPGSLSNADKNSQPIKGLFTGTMHGAGVFSKSIDTKINAQSQNFSYSAPALGTFQAPQASLTTDMSISAKAIKWQNFNLQVSDILLTSSGELTGWLSPTATYNARVGSKIADLGHMQKLIALEKEIADAAEQAQKQWTGKAEIEVDIKGDSKGSKVETQINAQEVLAKTIVEALPPEARSMASMLGFTDEAKLKGDLHIAPGNQIEVKNAQLPISVGTLFVQGTVDLKKDISNFDFTGQQLQLHKLQEQLNEKMHSNGKRSAEVARGVDIELDGLCNTSGKITLQKGRTDSSGTISLDKARFGLSDNSLDMHNILGTISWVNDKIKLSNISGGLGDGTFELEGNSAVAAQSTINLKLHAKHAQLDQLAAILRVLRLKLPVLTERQLYGRVRELTLIATGSPEKPNIYFSAEPDDAYYQPPAVARALNIRGGTIIYDHDNLSMKDLQVVMHGDKLTTSIEITDLSHSASLQSVKVNTSGIELADANYYLSSNLMPPPLRRAYTTFLKQFKLTNLHGRVYGDIYCLPSTNPAKIAGSIGMFNVGGRIGAHGFSVEHVQGLVSATNNRLSLQNMSGTVHSSKFQMSGYVDDYVATNPSWKIKMLASLESRELLEMVPAISDRVQAWRPEISSASALDLKATVAGDTKHNDIDFQLNCDPNDMLNVKMAYGTIYQPNGEAVVLKGILHAENNGAKLSDTKLTIGSSTLLLSGSVDYARSGDGRKVPAAVEPIDLPNSNIDFHLATSEPMPVYKMISMVDRSVTKKDVQGTIDCCVAISGSFNHPRPTGRLKVDQLTWVKCDLHNLTGTASLSQTGDGEKQIGKLEIDGVEYKKLPIKGIKSELGFSSSQAALTFNNAEAAVAGGSVKSDGSFNFNSHTVSFNCSIDKLKAAELTEQLFDKPGEISGLTDGIFSLSTTGSDYKTMISNLEGGGQVKMTGGTVSRFGHLQAKLTQANLLHQGLFGFNLNNLMQSVYPVRTGIFKDLSTNFQIDKGVLKITELRYNGDDMRLWGAGSASLPLNAMSIEIAGEIPRVESSVIGGPIGEVSRAFTLQRALDTLTMHRLESLPNLPVLGEIASNKPRTFGFKLMAPLDNSKLLVGSIEKSFHWLAPKPGATAHPVPGLQ